MFEQFPYADFHQLNLDWIIKIAKDFLDQYTHIQETIDTGLTDLQEKATELESLLQAWYDTHSEDIANELASAIADFQVAAAAAAQEAIASIPADYTELSNQVTALNIAIHRNIVGINVSFDVNTTTHSATVTGGRLICNGHEFRIPANTVINNLPQDNTFRYITADLDTDTDHVTAFNIETPPGGPWTNYHVYVGYAYNDTLALVPGCYSYQDGLRLHHDQDTWTEFPVISCKATGGPERMIVVNMQTETILIPSNMVILLGKYTISNTTEQIISYDSVTGNDLYLIYNYVSGTFDVTNTAVNRNKSVILACITRNMNYVYSLLPVLTVTNHSAYYDVKPDISVFGDSIAAGVGGLGFENIIAAKAGIRMLNNAIGATGYVYRVTAGTSHVAGNNTPRAGSNQVISQAENNVLDMITAKISTIEQPIVAFMAGRNDVANNIQLSAIQTNVEACIDIVQTAGKIPVIISPIRSQNLDLRPLVNMLESVCKTKGVPFINVYDCGINPDVAANKTYYIPDGIHPGDHGYYVLSAAIADGMKRLCMVDQY